MLKHAQVVATLIARSLDVLLCLIINRSIYSHQPAVKLRSYTSTRSLHRYARKMSTGTPHYRARERAAAWPAHDCGGRGGARSGSSMCKGSTTPCATTAH